MGWGRHKLLWDGNEIDKYVPWTTLLFSIYIYHKKCGTGDLERNADKRNW